MKYSFRQNRVSRPHRLAVPRRQIDPICAPHLMTAVSPVAVPNGGYSRIATRVPIMLCDRRGEGCAGIRRAAGPYVVANWAWGRAQCDLAPRPRRRYVHQMPVIEDHSVLRAWHKC